MADSVTAALYDGARNIELKLTNISDGTGEALVKKLDVTALNPNPLTHMKVRKIQYSIGGGGVALYWEGTPNVLLAALSEGNGVIDLHDVFAGGYPDNAASPTGNILLSTSGFGINSGYSIVLQLIKGISLN